MATPRQKEIASLRSKLAALEAEQLREEEVRALLEQAHAQLLANLKNSELTLELYVRRYYKEIRKLITKIEQEQLNSTGTKSVKRGVRKKVGKKKTRAKKARIQVKIPAGHYTNIPSAPDQVFHVKEKGPRPKALKAYAEEVGLEAFMAQCLMG